MANALLEYLGLSPMYLADEDQPRPRRGPPADYMEQAARVARLRDQPQRPMNAAQLPENGPAQLVLPNTTVQHAIGTRLGGPAMAGLYPSGLLQEKPAWETRVFEGDQLTRAVYPQGYGPDNPATVYQEQLARLGGPNVGTPSGQGTAANLSLEDLMKKMGVGKYMPLITNVPDKFTGLNVAREDAGRQDALKLYGQILENQSKERAEKIRADAQLATNRETLARAPVQALIGAAAQAVAMGQTPPPEFLQFVKPFMTTKAGETPSPEELDKMLSSMAAGGSIRNVGKAAVEKPGTEANIDQLLQGALTASNEKEIEGMISAMANQVPEGGLDKVRQQVLDKMLHGAHEGGLFKLAADRRFEEAKIGNLSVRRVIDPWQASRGPYTITYPGGETDVRAVPMYRPTSPYSDWTPTVSQDTISEYLREANAGALMAEILRKKPAVRPASSPTQGVPPTR